MAIPSAVRHANPFIRTETRSVTLPSPTHAGRLFPSAALMLSPEATVEGLPDVQHTLSFGSYSGSGGGGVFSSCRRGGDMTATPTGLAVLTAVVGQHGGVASFLFAEYHCAFATAQIQ